MIYYILLNKNWNQIEKIVQNKFKASEEKLREVKMFKGIGEKRERTVTIFVFFVFFNFSEGFLLKY